STLTGRVVAADGSALTSPLGAGGAAAPGAALYLQTAEVPPAEDPLADLALRTAPDGSFAIPALATGSYRLTVSALGLAPAQKAAIVAGPGTTDLGTITLGAGGVLSGVLRLPDGSAPSESEVLALAAASPDSSQFVYAALTRDPATRTVTGYRLGGLTPGQAYRLVVSGPGGTAYVPPEGADVVLASSVDPRALDLTLNPPAGPVSFRASRTGADWTVRALFPRPLRERYASDDDASAILSTVSALGAPSGAAIAADRMSVSLAYAPALGETSATFRARAALAATDWGSSSPSSPDLTEDATAVLPLSADGQSASVVSNAFGGALALDGDASRALLPRGAFAVDAASTVAVSFTRAPVPGAFGADAPSIPAASEFYALSLPAGVPDSLQRAATLTLAYSSSVADASGLRLYWWNAAARAYVLQPDALGGAPRIDASARTFTQTVAHFSTYVLLDASAGSLGGSSYGGGDLKAYNFPNPFDLSVKTVTTIHGGGSPSVRGTLISVSVPPGLSGGGTLRVFDVTGRRVREIDLGTLSGGRVYYQGWDGRNDSGADVASGLYIGQVEVGSRSVTFEMAVLK
ncbi:MAG: carboxypeptidase regulatory-like domain-containing protein, partial [Elusimicrobia bacterium]|nr:carboxypeptidase regulatory-like domain-containing protein [Elusimicrobiota bacterium]